MSEVKLRATFKVGTTPIVAETSDLKKLFLYGGFFANIPTKCGNCKSNNLTLNGTKNQGFEFYGILCRDCKHEMKYGQRKEDGGLFLKDSDGWQPPYSGGDQRQGDQRQGDQRQGDQRQGDQRQESPPDDDDDIPF